MHQVKDLLLLFSRSVMSDSFVTAWTVAHQAPLSMEFSRQEYSSELPFIFSRGSSQPKDQAQSSPALAGGFYTTVPPRKPIALVVEEQ